MDPRIEKAWDAEYERGRYEGEPPVTFVADIIAATRRHRPPSTDGVYIGCGNGRNYLPLIAGGLDLMGIDVSGVAIARLRERAPDVADRLLHGDLSALEHDRAFSVVIGIQVFQHGDRATAHAHIRAAQERVAPDGLFCIRVNSADTDVWPAHERVEQGSDGGFTVRYLEGPKRGLLVHFFSDAELLALFADRFEPVMSLRRSTEWRVPTAKGQWSQWEAIWKRAELTSDQERSAPA